MGWYLWFLPSGLFLPLYTQQLDGTLQLTQQRRVSAEMLKEAAGAAALCGVFLGSTEESQGNSTPLVGKPGEFLRECRGNIGNHMED